MATNRPIPITTAKRRKSTPFNKTSPAYGVKRYHPYPIDTRMTLWQGLAILAIPSGIAWLVVLALGGAW